MKWLLILLLTVNLAFGAPSVVMYGTPTCPACHAAESALKQAGITYKKIIITKATKYGDTVPQIIIDGQYIGGYAELLHWIQQNAASH